MSDNTPPSPAGTVPAAPRIKVWDLPLRLFHWALLVAVTVAIVSAEVGGNWMDLHGQAGLAVAGLLAFRWTWGLVGSRTARFAQFFPTPERLKAYLGGRWRGLGHNPLGALSVFALLGLLSAQVGTGLFGNDEIAFTGPLNGLVEESFGLRLTEWHEDLAGLLFVLLGLHVAAIVFHRVVKRHNLIKPMVTGWAEPDDEAATDPLPPAAAPRGALAAGGPIALLVALAVAAATLWVAGGGPWKSSAVAPAGASLPGTVPPGITLVTRPPAAGAAASAPASGAAPAW